MLVGGRQRHVLRRRHEGLPRGPCSTTGCCTSPCCGELGKAEFLRVFPKVYKGTHVDHPAVDVLVGREVRLEAPGADRVRRRRADRSAAGDGDLRAGGVGASWHSGPGLGLAQHTASRHGAQRGARRVPRGAIRSASTRSRSRRARPSRRAAACWSPRRPAPARRWSVSSPSTSRWPRAASASTRRRSRRCPTRSTTTSSQRYGADAGRPAHRRQHHQRRGAGRRHDDRGAAQHALRRLAHARRPRLRRDGRGALPRRPVPRARSGRR